MSKPDRDLSTQTLVWESQESTKTDLKRGEYLCSHSFYSSYLYKSVFSLTLNTF